MKVPPRLVPPLVFVVLALAVLLPLLLPGYILTLDMVFTPHLHYPLMLDNLWLFHAAMNSLNLIVPSQILEKLLLLAILAGAGLGMHRLVPAPNPWARYAAGVLYVVNPFTYARLMAGQYLVLAGYALMPWLLGALIRFTRHPGRGTAWRLAAWTAAVGFVSLHYLGFALLAGALALAGAVWRARRRPPQLARLAGWGAAVAGVVLVANSFWLVPLLLHRTAQAALIAGFDERYFLSFRTTADPLFGQMLNTLALYGFWGDAQGQYLLPKTAFSFWWFLAAIILALAATGAISAWRRQRAFAGLVLALAAVSFVLAQGIMGSPFAGLNAWFMDHVPFYRGYREPGKFIGLLALSVSALFGLGVGWVLERFRAEWLPGLFVALPLAYTPTMLWGAAGQLHAADYPADWYALNSRLKSAPPGRVLFLPWHQYLRLGFTGRIVSNPAPRFFDRPVIAGDNSQIGLIQRQSANPLSDFIEGQILDPSRHSVTAKLSAHGFRYVVLAKEADYSDYKWLEAQPGLRLVEDTPTLKVYEVRP